MPSPHEENPPHAETPPDPWDVARVVLLLALSHAALAGLILLIGVWAALAFPLAALASVVAAFAVVEHVKKHAFRYLLALLVGLALLGLGLAGKLEWAWQEMKKDLE